MPYEPTPGISEDELCDSGRDGSALSNVPGRVTVACAREPTGKRSMAIAVEV